MLLALNYMHMKGICHRDIKPQNIMYERRKYNHTNSFIRLIDFGFAIQEKNWKPSDGVGVGTLDYVAPEILNNEPLNNKSDLWALGVSVYCMLIGY